MPLRTTILLLILLASVSAQPVAAQLPPDTRHGAIPPSRAEVTVRYLANEGVLVSQGGRAVLIDALFGDGLPTYEALTPEERRRLETDPNPALRVEYVLATHGHRDHFDARAVGRYLDAVGGARFGGPRATVDALLRIDPTFGPRAVAAFAGSLPGWIRPLELPHGPTSVPMENVGWLLDLDGALVLHAGDAELSEEHWRAVAPERRIDVALLPYWYFLNDAPKAVVLERMRPREIILLHRPLPGREGEGLRGRGGWDAFVESVREQVPSVRVFEASGEEIRLVVNP